ncbi:MAG: amino acid ABC transporter permease [Actinobacteria bacterium]|nr:amino acid ABC transporter permease [Actinomycetota bacterium]
MKERPGAIALVLAVALLLCSAVAVVAPALALAQEGTPEIRGVSPNPESTRTTWGGDTVLVNFRPNGAVIDPDACELYINGERQEATAAVRAISQATATVIFTWPESLPGGEYDFRAVLATAEGVTVEREWSFDSEGQGSGRALISFQVMQDWFWFIARGAIVTVQLTVISIVLASILALFGALGRLSRKMSYRQAWAKYQSWGYLARMTLGRIPYWIATFYTSLFRGTPLLLQIIVIYTVTPQVIQYFGLPDKYNPPAFWSGVAALSLNYGAYLTEVFRAGIQAVPKGQSEAAWALGMSSWQTEKRIVLPQAFKIVIPAVGNDFIALIKDTSLVSVITVEELLRRSQLAGAATYNPLSTLLVAAAFYWALTIFFSFWQAKLERRMERDRARA